MSLRRRFILLLCLAVAALGAAVLAMLQLRAQSTTEREKAAFTRGSAVVEELLAQLEASPSPWPEASTPAQQEALRSFVASLVAPLGDASAGYCASDGTLLMTETVAPPGSGPGPRHRGPLQRPPALLPLDRDVVVEACRAQRAGHLEQVRFAAPNDILFLSLQGTDGSVAAWALVRMANRSREELGPGWVVNLGLMGALALALAVLTAEALWVLRRGAEDLRRALAQLPNDLRTEVPQPLAEELARVAEGLRAMAQRLLEARDRERLLERRLGHEQRLAALGRVAAGVAHEVRNPLTGMKLKLDGMLRRRLDERSQADVSICLQEIGRLDRVVSSLLLVAHREPPAKASLDFAVLADERLHAAEALAMERDVRLVREGSAKGRANREQLTRVIDNLVRNAIEASPPGAEVRIQLSGPEQEVSLAVVDHGEGIPPERQGELFEPFFTLKPEGTGLGLFLSRSLVEAHGGSLAYQRAPPETRFVVTLPSDAPNA